jgi:anti-sigma regulatory factor (Ser/Thr protein kinase)/CheY-like chemotaxis protein
MLIFHESAPATLREVSRLRREAGRKLCELRIPQETCERVTLAISETLANIVVHAQPSAGFFELRIELEGAAVRVDAIDDGGAFLDACAQVEVARARQSGAAAESGRGLGLIARAFARVAYASGGVNKFTGWAPLGARSPAILIVEDDPTLLDLYAHYLRDWPCVKAASLAEALAALDACDICAVVADLHLGDGLGSSLVAAMDATPERARPLVLVSAAPAADVARSCPAAEAILSKPIGAEGLRAGVEGAIARSALRSARHARAFARTLEGLLSGGVPHVVHGRDVALARCSAGVGGGDLVLAHRRADRTRFTLLDVMGHGVAAKSWAGAFAGVCFGLWHGDSGEADAFLLGLAEVAWREPALEEVVATALVIDVMADGELRIANAGHPPPAILGAGLARRLPEHGALLGVAPPRAYPLIRVRLEEGERLVAFTDGVDDAEASAGGPMPEWLRRACDAPELFDQRDGLERAARARLGAQPKDDWTILVLGAPCVQA